MTRKQPSPIDKDYSSLVMPFGLCNVPAMYEQLKESGLEGLYWKMVLIYLDDVIAFGQTFEQELERLSEIFRSLCPV